MPDLSTRQHILEAALRLLGEGGPDKLTQTRVARAAGVSQGHLTYYFPRKSDLWRAVTERAIAVFIQQFTALVPTDGAGASKRDLRDRCLHALSTMIKDREHGVVFLGLCLQVRQDPEIRRTLTESVRELRGLIGNVLGDGTDEDVLDLTLATVWGLGLRHYLAECDDDDERTDALLARAFPGGEG